MDAGIIGKICKSPLILARKVARTIVGRHTQPSEAAAKSIRIDLATRYIRGSGIEVGALHRPLWAPIKAKVKYVDRMTVHDLRITYPELEGLPLVNVDIVDDGEQLKSIADGSQNFVIANHFLEHAQNPIATLKRHIDVLKNGGVLYLAIPDKRFTFDVDRKMTTWEHLKRDYKDGPTWSYAGHIHEYATLVDKVTGD